jgi:6-pyruvoyltetrahydropterin/6-carboxytetrahydropterin synthase
MYTNLNRIFAAQLSMSMVYITRVEKFNAAHKLWVKAWSEEKNLEVFGKCANHNWHGHNYYLHVTVKGTPDPDTGFIMDAKYLSRLIKKHILDHLDHRNLNLDVEFIPPNIQPTTENLVVLIWKQLAPHIKGAALHRIKLFETDSIYAEYFGE